MSEPFCVLRMGRKSHTWAALREASAHTSRDAQWLGKNIDPGRRDRNEVMVGTGDVVADVQARLAAVGVEPRPGQVLAREVLLTASASFFGGRDGDWDAERLAAWKAAALDFLRAEWGDNLVTVVLHGDEAVPHLHCWATTTVRTEKKARGRTRKDGTRPPPTIGWTMNHDAVFGSGKGAFAERQDRYAAAMAPLGLRRGLRQSGAQHEPIRAYYARLGDATTAAERDRDIAHDARLAAIAEQARAEALRHGADLLAVAAKAAHAEAEDERRTARADAERARSALVEELAGERAAIDGMKRAMDGFIDRKALRAEFEDTLAVERLRNGRAEPWKAFERGLAAYAADLRQFGSWRAAMEHRARRHFAFLFDRGARALGHASDLHLPAADVVEGVRAWLRQEGGEALRETHGRVVGWLRDWLVSAKETARVEVVRERGRER
ncbi:plasmid recombination protein [Magnetospirillum sp. UT-4]|uniref:plasmid recombination protein n=1 Tax=Magnetospirillum sp. UT-4 TaxID=2681467 RepID=UPI0013837F27|nr:plasmid recombination protein [Magnetospirillum sp. UT-4]CAA7616582.1 hypothetical protein MTBUT4_230015 [Magnetospirillum sp. UT-4]